MTSVLIMNFLVFKTIIHPFILSEYVTNGDWMNFIEEGGYTNYEYWLSDGWDFINKNKIQRPMYWIDNSYCFDLSGINKIDKNPSCISYKLLRGKRFCEFC